MISPLILFLVAQTISIIALSYIGVVAAKRHTQELQQEIETENPSLETYLRFAVARNYLGYPSRWSNLWSAVLIGIPLVSLVINYYVVSIPGFLLFFLQVNVLYPIYLALSIGNTIGSSAYSFLRTVFSDAQAVRIFQISTLQRHEIAFLKIREALLQTLPSVLYMEAVALLLMLAPSANLYYLLALLFIFCSGAFVILEAVFDTPLYALKNKVEQLANTPWAPLAPRIAAWEQVGQVKFSSVLIQQDIREIPGVSVSGLLKPTLILNEFFLRHSDWRQQDALIGIAIGMVKKRMALHALLNRLAAWAIIAASVLLFFFSSLLPASLSSLTIAAPWIGMFIAFDVIKARSDRQTTKNLTEVYRMASFLTGDPNAVRVALSITSLFRGASAEQVQQDGQIQKLDELAQESWARAPQADEPVPTVSPESFDPYPLTVPLNQATAPGPVPTASYRELTLPPSPISRQERKWPM
ncbi:hypothetical protein KSF_111200 [Reticulibacter mediterranei]|uniref:Uncharacterized protein n=1 Tax=Reticulibacter mediterranei TaxID=2778369 RepID=A0A8J3NB39_9CHLR|nr:hypothetical protein [Reticulibacter mediterranei]GHP01073.1 hypothetical protein KSF_111200 [Reticulibacter mediterranei]